MLLEINILGMIHHTQKLPLGAMCHWKERLLERCKIIVDDVAPIDFKNG
jgi:hypothetical protein